MDEEELNNSILATKKIPFLVMVKRTWPYLKEEWKSFVLGILILLLQVGFTITLPLFEENVISLIEDIGVKTVLLNDIISSAIGYCLFSLLINISVYLSTMILVKAGQRIIYKLRMEAFSHIQEMSQNQFNNMPVGSLVTRVATYTTSISDLFTDKIANILVNMFTVVGVFTIMCFKSIKLSLILLIFVVFISLCSYFFMKYISTVFRKERQTVSDMNAFLNETLSGMKIVQLFGQEKNKQDTFNSKNIKLRSIRYNFVLAWGIYRPLMAFTSMLAIAVIFVMGPKLSLSGAEVLAFYIYMSSFFNPIQEISDKVNELQKGFSGLEKLFNLMDIKPEVVDKEDAIDLNTVKGDIEFKNVWFAYVKDEWILKDVSFKIKAGDTCAFVGPTGAGKTTILGLIVRNFVPQKGDIFIDGVNIKDIKIDSLRGLIGQMLQDVFLFSGTVKDNITLFDNQFSQEDIDNACKYVNADTFIDKLPNKYDEKVDSHGENFSQGQRQLLSFARTVIHKPSILILDEATANIDTETEALIQNSLEKMRNIGTMLVVAHRLSTIQKSDQIIVLNHGEIVEKGTHQELLKNRGQYYKLYQLQFEE